MNLSGRKSLKYRGYHCLNCGHALKQSDVYCSQCSQLNSDKPLSARDFFAEFLSSILVYDSRLWTTLRDLVGRPGTITKSYVKGQRMKYANPFRFFLSVSIIYFLFRAAVVFFGFSDRQDFININYEGKNNYYDANRADSIVSAISESHQKTFSKDTLFAQKLGIPAYYPEKSLDTLSLFDRIDKKMGLFKSYYSRHKEVTADSALVQLRYNTGTFNTWLYSRMISQDKVLHDPNAFIRYLSSKIPFFLFFFTPLFALGFLVFYSRKRFSYMEHVIFIFHIFSFIFLVMILFNLLDIVIGHNVFIPLLFMLIGPLYFFLALYRFYGQRFFSTLVKFVVLSLIFNLSFFTAVLVFVIGGAALY